MILSVITAAVREHWPKIVAAVLVAVCVALLAKCERAEVREENRMVQTGRDEVTIEQQERTIRNVEKAQNAERNPTLDDRERVRSKYDRCAAPGSDCQ